MQNIALIWTMRAALLRMQDHVEPLSRDTFLTRRSDNASSLFTVVVKGTKTTFLLLRIAR